MFASLSEERHNVGLKITWRLVVKGCGMIHGA